MAKEIRTETDSKYVDECRKDSRAVQTIHRQKVTTTTTFYDDGTSRVTDVQRNEWVSTGVPC